ncbi:MAG: branched-chain amino acid ABC transporter permease [Comamonadaceae bacterium SCN 68-20]|jgi:branched-chain amino acid transport system permease protein|nr:branched-chain amino acid ABC transporter permease [Comamonadaceae bacterium]MBN9367760.1 branched-chain amino acid ABC transporter permease [Comamonadaceae bacterium]ODU59133.1 MAG: branched-chain amino acid ABC transporter permease [Comamonadaceae bacterium SCN 68-20]OJX14290.1 MAG: branched-chain amino acid ABC transporter permease [Burkholderiales bacterium 68-20]
MTDILVHGAVTSAIYAMLAVGFTLVFGVARILNLAHGAFYMLGAYFTYLFATLLGLPLALAALAAIAATAGLGWAVERWLIRPQRDSSMAVMMVTMAFLLVAEQVLLVTFGSEVVNVPAFADAKFSLGGADIGGQQLLTLATAVAALAVLWLLIQRTRAGAAILALSQDPLAAQYMGIPIDRVYGRVVALSAALAALAGVMAGPFLSTSPHMAMPALTKAFAIVIVGGLGSLPGSILAAILLGYAETAVAYLVSSSWTEVVSLAAVLLTLLLRPAGLRGKRAAF